MPSAPRLSAVDAETLLVSAGFQYLERRGTHRIYGRERTRVIVPFDGAQQLHPKAVRMIVASIERARHEPTFDIDRALVGLANRGAPAMTMEVESLRLDPLPPAAPPARPAPRPAPPVRKAAPAAPVAPTPAAAGAPAPARPPTATARPPAPPPAVAAPAPVPPAAAAPVPAATPGPGSIPPGEERLEIGGAPRPQTEDEMELPPRPKPKGAWS